MHAGCTKHQRVAVQPPYIMLHHLPLVTRAPYSLWGCLCITRLIFATAQGDARLTPVCFAGKQCAFYTKVHIHVVIHDRFQVVFFKKCQKNRLNFKKSFSTGITRIDASIRVDPIDPTAGSTAIPRRSSSIGADRYRSRGIDDRSPALGIDIDPLRDR